MSAIVQWSTSKIVVNCNRGVSGTITDMRARMNGTHRLSWQGRRPNRRLVITPLPSGQRRKRPVPHKGRKK